MITSDQLARIAQDHDQLIILIGLVFFSIGIMGGGLEGAGWKIPVITAWWRQAVLLTIGVGCLLVIILGRGPCPPCDTPRDSYAWVDTKQKGDWCCENIAISKSSIPISLLGSVHLCDNDHNDYRAICWENRSKGFADTPRDFVPPRSDWCTYKVASTGHFVDPIKENLDSSDIGKIYECKPL